MSDPTPQGTPPAKDAPPPAEAVEGGKCLSFQNVDRPAAPRRPFPRGQDDPMRYVFVEAVRCPRCDSRHVHFYGKAPTGGDDATARYTLCTEAGCGQRFITITE